MGGSVTGLTYADSVAKDANYRHAGGETSAITITSSSRINVEDVKVYSAEQGPGLALVSLGITVTDCTIRNIGTYAAPLDLSFPVYHGIAVSRTATTLTITHNNHRLVVGDRIPPVYVSSAIGGFTSTSKLRVVSVPDANTFTVTVSNSGATSATISY